MIFLFTAVVHAGFPSSALVSATTANKSENPVNGRCVASTTPGFLKPVGIP